MIGDNFKISGTSEALLDINDQLGVHVKDDNLQGFDTKWDEILFLSMTRVPDEDILEINKKQFRYSEELAPLTASYLQDPDQEGLVTLL